MDADELTKGLLTGLTTIGPVGAFILAAFYLYLRHLKGGGAPLFGARKNGYATAAELAVQTAHRHTFTVADVVGATHAAFEKERTAIHRTADQVDEIERRQENFNAQTSTIVQGLTRMVEMQAEIMKRLDRQLEERVDEFGRNPPRRRRR